MAVTTGYKGNVKIGANAVSQVMSASCDITWNTEDTTAFDPSATNAYFQTNAPTVKSVSGSFECNLDYSDTNGQKALIDELFTTADGLVTDLTFYPYGTAFGVKGNAIVSFSLNAAASSVAKATFNFTGTGAWVIVTS